MSVLAIVSKSEFEKALSAPRLGDTWKVTAYVSRNPALESLRAGGDLYLVTVRPGDELWLAAVLRSPTATAQGWTARANTVPLVAATAIVKHLRFATGKGIAAGPGKLGMSLQTPRVLTDDDVARLEGLLVPRGTRAKPRSKGALAKPPAKRVVPSRSIAPEVKSSGPARHVIERLSMPPGLAGFPLTGPWRGPLKHIGPDKFTPLKQSLLDKTNSAIYALLSGVMLWGAERLRASTEVAPLEDLALALFCFQQDRRYLRRPATIADLDTIEAKPRAEATVLYLLDTVYQDHIYERGLWSDLPMWGTAAEAINLVRHNLPPAAATVFDRWLGGMIARLDRLAPFADPGDTPTPKTEAWREEVMGTPLPPSVLDLSVEPQPSTFAAEWTSFLASLDPATSIHLRSRAELVKAGFKGTPYRSHRNAKR